jgi:diguanylate cyclase (GGDEF)-like protein/hemerythrin-like metal-binding protein
MNAHVPTMFLAIILIGSVLSLSVGAVVERNQHDGMPYWAAGLALHTAAYILFSLRGQVGDLFSIVLANMILSSALAAFTEGLHAFYKSRPSRRLIWIPVIIVFLTFLVLLNDLRLRIIVGCAVFILQCLLALRFMWGRRRQTAGRGKYFLAAGMLTMTALLLLRVAGAASNAGEAMLSLTQPNLIQTLSLLGALISLLLLAIGFVLMSKERSDQLNLILATQDELTGLANRRRFNEALATEWARANRSGQALTLAMIDIDQFKDYNDHYGHPAGDVCLQRVAQVIASTAKRAGDLAARYGGEEFVLILPDTDAPEAQDLAENLRKAIDALALAHLHSLAKRITVSIGVAVLSEACFENSQALLGAADAALYRAKNAGRNQVQMAPESQPAANATAGAPTKLLQLTWRAAYESGNALIDEQHRTLFRDVNALLNAALLDRNKNEVAALADTFIAGVVHHFQQEESTIRSAGFPGADEHAQQHRVLLGKAYALTRNFRAGTLPPGELFEYLAHELVARHVLVADREFFTCLKA